MIKDVDEAAHRILKREAVKGGLKVGEAASQAFRLWLRERSSRRVKDFEKIRRASREIDRLRERIGRVPGHDSTKVIREWRERGRQ